MSDEIPRHEMLIKLMGMTGSTNDNEALVALRKANDLLRTAGWDWERVLRGKIKVVDNPFAGKNPFGEARIDRTQDAQPTPRRKTTAPTPPPPRPPRPVTDPGPGMMWVFDSVAHMWARQRDPHYAPTPLGTRKNIYAGYCYCCGTYVANEDGKIFKPRDFTSAAKDGWAIACISCNNTSQAFIPSRPAPKQTGQTTVNLGDL